MTDVASCKICWLLSPMEQTAAPRCRWLWPGFRLVPLSLAMRSRGPQRPPEQLVLVGTAASRFTVAPIAPELHGRTLVLHGEQDDTVPLASVMDWARPQSLPITVIPGVAHFFHGQLPLLRSLVVRHLLAENAP